ncbi:MAG: metalloregulator ArsR/SmtB family transcription factor [Verrucomicrobia bacterium]|nr:metalloregulator ArsR/SmtB family transcription factor [Verrucomicrobiota bacterium]
MNNERKPFLRRELFDQFARIGKVLASGARLELLDLLCQAERSVEELADETGMSVANVSQHLQVMRRARMVEVRREGLYSHYRLADENVFRVWLAVRALGEARLLEVKEVVRTYLSDRDKMEAVTAEELVRRLEVGDAVVLDVRPTKEYDAGHIPEAVSIPLGELKKRLKELPRRKEIVAYCRGPYCVQSDAAVALLASHGFKARRMTVGLPEWRAGGFPVAQSIRN